MELRELDDIDELRDDEDNEELLTELLELAGDDRLEEEELELLDDALWARP
jgi:hypothetical protein